MVTKFEMDSEGFELTNVANLLNMILAAVPLETSWDTRGEWGGGS